LTCGETVFCIVVACRSLLDRVSSHGREEKFGKKVHVENSEKSVRFRFSFECRIPRFACGGEKRRLFPSNQLVLFRKIQKSRGEGRGKQAKHVRPSSVVELVLSVSHLVHELSTLKIIVIQDLLHLTLLLREARKGFSFSCFGNIVNVNKVSSGE
jgi:hypothetical protein